MYKMHKYATGKDKSISGNIEVLDIALVFQVPVRLYSRYRKFIINSYLSVNKFKDNIGKKHM